MLIHWLIMSFIQPIKSKILVLIFDARGQRKDREIVFSLEGTCTCWVWWSRWLSLSWGVFYWDSVAPSLTFHLLGRVKPVTEAHQLRLNKNKWMNKLYHYHHSNCSHFHRWGTSANPNSLVGTLAFLHISALPEGNLDSQALKWSSLAVLQDISSPPWRESNITEALACFLSSPWRRRKLPAVEHSTLHLRMMEEKERRREQSVWGGGGHICGSIVSEDLIVQSVYSRGRWRHY